jgi:phage-related protein
MPATEVRLFRDKNGEIPVQMWLDGLRRSEPKARRKCLARILELADHGNAMRRPHADYLRDAIHELRASRAGIHYRMLYFFCGKNVVVVSHGLTKRGQVPDEEIEFAIACMNLVRTSPDKYTADFDII